MAGQGSRAVTGKAGTRGAAGLPASVPAASVRLDGLRPEVVQGELFAENDEEDAGLGYRGTVASRVAGITYRQLDYWARKQIVVPSIKPSHGSGSRRLYSFKDVLILAVSKRLLDTGVNLQNVTAAIGFLSRHKVADMEHMTIICDGQDVRECGDNDEVLDLIEKGTAVFAVSVGRLWRQVDEALKDEPSVEVTPSDTANSGTPSRPIDELAAVRMREKLRSQHQIRAKGDE
ncbi:MerR family transcriptional regulator [Bifidobacterium sp. ESL0763]|uniref:MerR family transcriptional regulator n=1 Tax=Bifidobacterium sp. ESL0763 TaxID=2983227 RepID=UPI0023F95966|nr:MerR family transcriptional regulator [Bifidobacterium sp. ESL0763]MDF7663794.1 MerR family transcriptional regulator [Bifidobacterium sp. ESL0763]